MKKGIVVAALAGWGCWGIPRRHRRTIRSGERSSARLSVRLPAACRRRRRRHHRWCDRCIGGGALPACPRLLRVSESLLTARRRIRARVLPPAPTYYAHRRRTIGSARLPGASRYYQSPPRVLRAARTALLRGRADLPAPAPQYYQEPQGYQQSRPQGYQQAQRYEPKRYQQPQAPDLPTGEHLSRGAAGPTSSPRGMLRRPGTTTG
jgi:hypothetical protein